MSKLGLTGSRSRWHWVVLRELLDLSSARRWLSVIAQDSTWSARRWGGIWRQLLGWSALLLLPEDVRGCGLSITST